jgi:hypothetical protein
VVFAGTEGDILGTVGVFLSGAGSVLTGALAIRWEKKRGDKECAERFNAFMRGMKIREELDHEG